MTKQKIEYKWKTLGIGKFKQVRKSEGVTAAKLKKEYWFTAKQIQILEDQWKLNFTLHSKTKYYDKEDVLREL